MNGEQARRLYGDLQRFRLSGGNLNGRFLRGAMQLKIDGGFDGISHTSIIHSCPFHIDHSVAERNRHSACRALQRAGNQAQIEVIYAQIKSRPQSQDEH